MKTEIAAYHDIEVFVKEILDINWLWPKQWEMLREFYNPNKTYTTFVAVCGMRSGKTTVASIIQCKELFDLLILRTPAQHYGLPKGQQIFVMNVASSEQQSKDTIFAQTKARIDNSKWFQEQDFIQRGSEFVFEAEDAEIVLRSSHSNSGSIAGKTSKCVLFDEIARFKQTGGPGSAKLVYETMSRQVKTFGDDGKIVSISSPMYVDDFQMQLYRMHKDNDKSYVIHLPTWEMNPNLPFDAFQTELQTNPEAFWRDFGAQPPSSLELFFKEPGRIANSINHKLPILIAGEYEWAKGARGESGFYYVMAGDPALKNDAFGLAMGHYEEEYNRIVIDLAHRFVPGLSVDRKVQEINAAKVKKFIIEGIARYNITHFITDTWNFPETIQEIEAHGVIIEQNHVKKLHYDNLKELIYMNPPGIYMPENAVLIEELKGLELLRGERVDHPRYGSKDVSDAVANVTWALKNMEIDIEEPIFVRVDL